MGEKINIRGMIATVLPFDYLESITVVGHAFSILKSKCMEDFGFSASFSTSVLDIPIAVSFVSVSLCFQGQ